MQRMFKLLHNCTYLTCQQSNAQNSPSQASTVRELSDVQTDLGKAEEPEIKLPTSAGSWKKQENSRKNIYFCYIDYAKTFDCVDHNKLWRILQDMGIPDHLTCLLRNLCAGQEETVRTRHGTTDWFQIANCKFATGLQIANEVRDSCILSPCLFNL